MSTQEHEPRKFWAIYGTSKKWAWECECGAALIGFASVRAAEAGHKRHAEFEEAVELRKQVRG